jgi:hypothetical protein
VTDGHLTDEQLSSHLDELSGIDRDDRAGQTASEHLAGCVECRHRLAGLEAARDLVRTPVPPVAPDVRAASIASVLRAAEDTSLDARSQVHTGNAPVPMRTPRRPRVPVLVGSAAAALVLVVAVGVPLALLSHGASSDSTASAPSTPSASGGVAASAGSDRLGQQHQRQASGTAGSSGSAHAAISDLGALDSLGQLRSRVTAALSMDVAAAPSGAASAPTSVPAPTGAAPTTAGAAPTTTGVFGSTATTSTTGTGSFSQSTFNVAAALETAPFARCLSSAMRAAGSNRSVQFLASAEFRSAPALVYVFLPASGGSATGNEAHSLVVATARDGCRVLGTTTL